jgi:hypothetical protein
LPNRRPNWSRRLSAAAGAADHDREDEVWASYDQERHRIEDAIRDAPLADLRDLAVKALVLTGEGCWALPDATILECAALVGHDFAKMPRCLFERDEDAA